MYAPALNTLARSITSLATLHPDTPSLMELNGIHHTLLNEAIDAGLQPVRSHMVGFKLHQGAGLGFLFQAKTDPAGHAQLLLSVPHLPPALGLWSPFLETLSTLALRNFVAGEAKDEPIRDYIDLVSRRKEALALSSPEDLLALSNLGMNYLLVRKEPVQALTRFDQLIDHVPFSPSVNLNARVRNLLIRRGVRFVGQLVRLPRASLPTGTVTRRTILNYLESQGLTLGMDIEGWQPPARHHSAFMATPIDTLILSPTKTENATLQRMLAKAGAAILGDVLRLIKDELMKMRYFNIGHYHQIRAYLRELGLDFDECL